MHPVCSNHRRRRSSVSTNAKSQELSQISIIQPRSKAKPDSRGLAHMLAADGLPATPSYAVWLRLALIRSTINTFDEMLPPVVIGRAVKLGIWSFEHAMNKSRSAKPERRAAIYAELAEAPAISDAQRAMLSDLVWRAYREIRLAAATFHLGDILAAVLRVTGNRDLTRVGDAMDELWSESLARPVLRLVIDRPDHPLRDRAIDLAFKLADKDDWKSVACDALLFRAPRFRVRLANALSRIEALGEFGWAQGWDIGSARAEALQRIAPALGVDLLHRAEAIVRAMTNPLGLTIGLAAISQQRTGVERERLIDEVIELVKKLPNEDSMGSYARVDAMEALGAQLTESQAESLEALVLNLPPNGIEKGFGTLVRIASPHRRAHLKKLALEAEPSWLQRRLSAQISQELSREEFDAWMHDILEHKDIEALRVWSWHNPEADRITTEQADRISKLIGPDIQNNSHLALILPEKVRDSIMRADERRHDRSDWFNTKFYEIAADDQILGATQRNPAAARTVEIPPLLSSVAGALLPKVREELASWAWEIGSEAGLPWACHAIGWMTPQQAAIHASQLAAETSDIEPDVEIVEAFAAHGRETRSSCIELAARFTSSEVRLRILARVAEASVSVPTDDIRNALLEAILTTETADRPLASAIIALAGLDETIAVSTVEALPHDFVGGVTYSSAISTPRMVAARALFQSNDRSVRCAVGEQFAAMLLEDAPKEWLHEGIANLMQVFADLNSETTLKLARAIFPCHRLRDGVHFAIGLEPYLGADDQNSLRKFLIETVRDELERARKGKSKNYLGQIKRGAIDGGEVDKADIIGATAILLSTSWCGDRVEWLSLMRRVIATFEYSTEFGFSLMYLCPNLLPDEIEYLVSISKLIAKQSTEQGARALSIIAGHAPPNIQLDIFASAIELGEEHAAEILGRFPSGAAAQPRLSPLLREECLSFARRCSAASIRLKLLRTHARLDDAEELNALKAAELEMLAHSATLDRGAVCNEAITALDGGGHSHDLSAQEASQIVECCREIIETWRWV